MGLLIAVSLMAVSILTGLGVRLFSKLFVGSLVYHPNCADSLS